MAVAGFMCNTYNGVENILKNLLRMRGMDAPSASPSSHKDLLDQAVETGVLSEDIREDLDEFRAFRHVFVHGYGLMLKPDQLEPLAARLPEVWTRLRRHVERMLAGS